MNEQMLGQLIEGQKSLGREIGDLKEEVGENRKAITDLRVELAKRPNGLTKRLLAFTAVWVAAAGGLGYLLHSLAG